MMPVRIRWVLAAALAAGLIVVAAIELSRANGSDATRPERDDSAPKAISTRTNLETPAASSSEAKDLERKSTSRPEPSAPPSEIAIRELLRAQQQEHKELDETAYGSPQPWPNNAPEKYREAHFRKVVTETMSSCSLNAGKTEVDCEEPPCIVLFFDPDFDDFQKVGKCGAWSRDYGEVTGGNMTRVECDDGPVQVHMISPYWKEYWETPDAIVKRRRLDRLIGRYKLHEAAACER